MSVGVNQLISTSEMLSISNGMGKCYEVLDPLLGTGVSTTQASYWGLRTLGRVVGEVGISYGVADRYKHLDLDAGALDLSNFLRSDTFWQNAAANIISGLESNITKYGKYLNTAVTTLDSYATYHNGENDFSMIYNYGFAALYYYVKGKSLMLSSTNVLSPQVILGSGTVTGPTAVTFTDGAAIGTVNSLSSGVQGYAPDLFELVVTSGTLTGTVTATAINQSGVSGTWRVIANAQTSADPAAQFAPVTNGTRTTDVTALSYTGDGASATFDIRSVSRDLSL